MVSFVIEHMEADEEGSQSLPPWVELEYRHMRSLAGHDSTVYFTHLSSKSCSFLQGALGPNTSGDMQQAGVHVTTKPITELMAQHKMALEKVCLLDPKAELELQPEDGDGRFEWFLFGGILGDDPPRDRTSELRQMGFPGCHLGPVQMTTDTALGVTKLVVVDGVSLSNIQYVDMPEIRFSEKESMELPFRYIAKPDGEPLLPEGMRELLYEELNKSF
jgi:ribosome biogenesis SPOUT family RNA methylase Rps3